MKTNTITISYPTNERPYFTERKPKYTLEGKSLGYGWFVRNFNDPADFLEVETMLDAYALASHLNEA
jgi:hypothetical protein